MRVIRFCALAAVLAFTASVRAQDDSQPVDRNQYASREMLPDPTAAPCQNELHLLTQVNGNLYRHVIGRERDGYSGLVLITNEGALVVDPEKTCASVWLKNEIDRRFHVPVKYVILSHAHFDHMAGSQIFQQAGATVIAHKNALEPIIGNKLPSAVPDRVFDKQMTITLGGETVVLYRIAPSHSNSMIQVYFPKYKALDCPDVCRGDTLPFQDLHDMYYDGWIETINWVLKQDIDFIDTGHDTANLAQQQVHLDYMLSLHDQILSLIRQGKTWEEMFRNVTFSDKVKGFRNFNSNWTMNMLGMYRWVNEHHRSEY
jgi:glyoxylase-like metal-dependent hydrolase (beta-lactamase superfamily II)